MNLNLRAIHARLVTSVTVCLACVSLAGCATSSSPNVTGLPEADQPILKSVAAPTPGQRDLLSDVPDALAQLKNGSIPAEIVPSKSGIGLVIGCPISTGVSPGVQSFGDACSLWLQVVAAGQPALGRTPSPNGLARAVIDLPCPGLRLTTVDVKRLLGVLGVTHAALCVLTGKGPDYTLTYQVYSTSTEVRVGPVVALSGTQDQIMNQLPGAAKRIDSDLGIARPSLPNTIGCDAADMSFLGRTWWSSDPTDTDDARIAALASHCSLAAFINLSYQTDYTPHESQQTVDSALEAFPENPFVYGCVAADYPSSLAKYKAHLSSDLATQPNSFLYNAALANMYGAQQGAAALAVKAGIQAVSSDPGNSSAWLMLARLYSSEAESIRRSRTLGGLSSAKWAQITPMYQYWLGCSERAAQLDPLSESAWTEVSDAAGFLSVPGEMDAAMRHALHIAKDPYVAYSIALEMYRPIWYSDSDKLNAAATLAANDSSITAFELIELAEGLGSTDYPTEYHELLDAAAAKVSKSIAANSNNAEAHAELAKYYDDIDDSPDAQAEYQTACKLAPKNPQYEEALGEEIYNQGFTSASIGPYLAAAAIEPAYPDIHCDIGLAYKREGKYQLAIEQENEELQNYPSSVAAYSALGDIFVLTKQPAKAANAYLSSCKIYSWSAPTWVDAAWSFDEAGNIRSAMSTITEGETYFPDYSMMEVDKQDCLIKLKRPQSAVELCEYDLQVLKDSESIAYTHENLGEAYLAEHQLSKARAEWRIALGIGDADVNPVAQGFLTKYGR